MITQRKILSLVYSVCDPIRLSAPSCVHFKRIVNSIWTTSRQPGDGNVEPGVEPKFILWRKKSPSSFETSIDRRWSILRGRNKTELVFADTSEDAICAAACLRSQTKEYFVHLVLGKC